MKRVLVRPSFQDWCGNRLFTHGTSHQGVYRQAFGRWRDAALAMGIAVDTWDSAPVNEADVLWFLDLPTSFREFCRIKAQFKPDCKIVLQVLETPALSWNVFNAANLEYFDAVVTYENPPVPGQKQCSKVFHYRLPNTFRQPPANPLFNQRKGLVALNSNRVEGLWAVRQPGLAGLPLVGKALSGWKFTFTDLQQYMTGELYSVRRKFLRHAEKACPDFLDLFGAGWNGEQISWCPLYRNRPYSCWRGRSSCNKDELCAQYRFVLAFENFRGNRGYLSEKIFDAFCAGTVPVYLGEERIAEFVPPSSFVDARSFASHRALLLYLKSCPGPEWQAMREAGQNFLKSEAMRQFGDEAFAEQMLEVLKRVLF
jgi:alpha(1,3/1,4) fucosyltransferase